MKRCKLIVPNGKAVAIGTEYGEHELRDALGEVMHVHGLEEIELTFAKDSQQAVTTWAARRAKALLHALRNNPPEDEYDRDALLSLLELQINIMQVANGRPCEVCATEREAS